MLHVSVIGHFKFKKRSNGWRANLFDILIPIIGIAVLLPVLLHIDNYAKIIGGIWLVIGIIILILNKNKCQIDWLETNK